MKMLSVLLSLISLLSFSRDPYPRNDAIDIKHYTFQLEFNDSTDIMAGEAIVTVSFRRPLLHFELDLVGRKSKGLGMQVQEVTRNGVSLKFMHQNDRLKISLPSVARAGEQFKFTIRYSGIPEDGVVISKNKFGDRTIFGDNWPDRGHHWLPVIDHPSDKAQVEFIIIAPDKYQVIATGEKIEESNITKNRKLTHWKESAEVPVKVMTMGIARFAVQQSGVVNNIPVTTWVFPQNREDGFKDFEVAPKIMEFLTSHIGPYSYEKLAHVQSKTRWGGLENASNIFYFENSVTGKKEIETLIAHETAHQWFGNSVSENDWHHVWLSEGFATYFTNLYMENAYGRDKLMSMARDQRTEVINYYKQNQSPVIDTTITEIGKVLSINTYQKAGWILHMLRNEVGDASFWKGIQQYYRTYQNRNALTRDFRLIMEDVSGKDLDQFFSQWLYKPGHPILEFSGAYDPKTKNVNISVSQQQQATLYNIPLEIGLYNAETGLPVIKRVQFSLQRQKFSIPVDQKPSKIVLDPNVNLLFEEKSKN